MCKKGVRVIKEIDLKEHLERIARRKAELGIVDTPECVEAMRNKGFRRTPEKRELLRRIAERCKMLGIDTFKSYF